MVLDGRTRGREEEEEEEEGRGKEKAIYLSAVLQTWGLFLISLFLSPLSEVLLYRDEPVLVLVILPEQSGRFLACHVNALRSICGNLDNFSLPCWN